MLFSVCAGKYVEGKKPWTAETKYDVALPCATQNEIGKDDAEALVKAGVKLVAEGANMPTESDAIAVFHKNNVVYAPGKVSAEHIHTLHSLCHKGLPVCPTFLMGTSLHTSLCCKGLPVCLIMRVVQGSNQSSWGLH